jgi:serine/threonine-protein kinase HipA
MNRCPITYSLIEGGRYSPEGLKLLANGLSDIKLFEYTAEEQRKEAYKRASKMSIQGVQPKLSTVFNIKHEKFEIADRGGRYILKPQHSYFSQMPENEDLSMRLAAEIDLEVPPHGMIWSKDNTLSYFIKRFDRRGQNEKVPMEDFAQLAGMSRDTKYNYSMEKVVMLVDKYCTFPAIEKVKLFKMTLFSFVIGNDDMHLKNFSIINHHGNIQLSPCYDLVNTIIEYRKPDDEIALPLRGSKKNLTKNMLISYFGKEQCELTDKVIAKVLDTIINAVPKWREEIEHSFLSEEMKQKYIGLLDSRLSRLELA